MPKFIKLDQGYFFVTSTVQNWNIFPDQDYYYNTLIEDLNYRIEGNEIELNAYVLMPNHIHLLGYFEDLPNTMRKFKSITSKKLNSYLEKSDNKFNLENGIWQRGYYAVDIYTKKFYLQKLNYIHTNPSRSKLIENDLDWKYSSLRNYHCDDGVIPVVWGL